MKSQTTDAGDPRRRSIGDFLEALAAGCVLPPLTIVLLATLVFAFKGSVQSWLLPVATFCALVSLRFFCASWRQSAKLSVLILLGYGFAYVVAAHFYDPSWDGQGYHQEAVLRLAAGWNPFYGNAEAYGRGSEIWIDHYPKASWIAAAAVLKTLGHIEGGKLFTLTLALAAALQTSVALLRLTRLRIAAVVILSSLAALNPVFIYQSATFYVDNLVGSLLTVAAAGLVTYLSVPRRATLAISCFALALAINLKFTGLIDAVVFAAAAVAGMWARQNTRSALRLGVVLVLTGAAASFLVGYSPYVRNLKEKGNPLYPAFASNVLSDYMNAQRPANMDTEGRVSRFFISCFSESNQVRAPESTTLKIPFSLTTLEKTTVWNADVEAGGFGPFYGGILLLAFLGSATLMVSQDTRSAGLVVGFISLALAASIFTISETWWARYVPQAWLIPLLVSAACWSASKPSLRWLAFAIVGFSTINVLFIGFHFARLEWGFTRQTKAYLHEMALAPKPVIVYLDAFRPLRERLKEGHIDFQMLDLPPPQSSTTERFDFPRLYGKAFWVK